MVDGTDHTKKEEIHMRRRRRSSLLCFALLPWQLSLAGCSDDGGGHPPTPSAQSESRMSEDDAIAAVKARLAAHSEPRTEYQWVHERRPCTEHRAAYDSRCRPCSPGNPSYCVEEQVRKPVEVSGGSARCPFPPSPGAEWSATYHHPHREWDVESNEVATGRNSYTVDDRTGQVISGYCIN